MDIQSHPGGQKSRGTLYRYLRRRGRKPNRRGKNAAGRGVIPGRVDVRERPGEVEEKKRVGDLGSGRHGGRKAPRGACFPGEKGV